MMTIQDCLLSWVFNPAAIDGDSPVGTPWILDTGSWDDGAFWVDTAVWNDGGAPLVNGFSNGFNTGFGA